MHLELLNDSILSASFSCGILADLPQKQLHKFALIQPNLASFLTLGGVHFMFFSWRKPLCWLPVSKNANYFLVSQLKIRASHTRHLCIPVYWVLLSSCTQTLSIVRWSWAVSEQETVLWNLQSILGICHISFRGSIAWEDQQQCVDARSLHYWEVLSNHFTENFCVMKEGHTGIYKHFNRVKEGKYRFLGRWTTEICFLTALANYSCGKYLGVELGLKPLAVHWFCLLATYLICFIEAIINTWKRLSSLFHICTVMLVQLSTMLEKVAGLRLEWNGELCLKKKEKKRAI